MMMLRNATAVAAAVGLCLLWTPTCVSACGSCLGSLALTGAGISSTNPTSRSGGGAFNKHNPHRRPHVPSASATASRKTTPGSPVSKSALGLLAIRHVLSQMDWAAVGTLKSRIFASDSSSGETARASSSKENKEAPDSSTSDDALEDMLSDDSYETPEQRGVDPECMARSKEGQMTAGMTGAIGFYKGWISPILPPACRFVPTCSQYGVQAIQEFGPTKGSLLTAWRLMRCSPLGGKGYDPPRWPPVPYNYASY